VLAEVGLAPLRPTSFESLNGDPVLGPVPVQYTLYSSLVRPRPPCRRRSTKLQRRLEPPPEPPGLEGAPPPPSPPGQNQKREGLAFEQRGLPRRGWRAPRGAGGARAG